MAKVLVIGSGGREHAICYKFKQSPQVETVFVAPGNPGMADVATLVDISGNDFDKLIEFAKEKEIDLTFVGPEIPLCLGIVDRFNEAGLKVFGPSEKAAQLEGSKVFSKMMMEKYNIPTAKHKSFDSYEEALNYLNKQETPIVIKADGLAAGKGVIIPTSIEDARSALMMMMVENQFENAGNRVVIEEYLEGEEFSLLAFVNEDVVIPMQLAQDHKRAFDNDEGFNTGGMGAYTPMHHISKEVLDEAINNIMIPMANAMVNEGCPFTGILYGGCMLTKNGVKTIEFNVRFGDPETEVILPALKDDLYQVIMDVLDKKDVKLNWDDKSYCGVVLASNGYPNIYQKGHIITGLENVNTLVFHMGTALKDNSLVTNGGRVLFVVGVGDSLLEAKNNAYKEIEKIKCDNLFYRKDIGNKGL